MLTSHHTLLSSPLLSSPAAFSCTILTDQIDLKRNLLKELVLFFCLFCVIFMRKKSKYWTNSFNKFRLRFKLFFFHTSYLFHIIISHIFHSVISHIFPYLNPCICSCISLCFSICLSLNSSLYFTQSFHMYFPVFIPVFVPVFIPVF